MKLLQSRIGNWYVLLFEFRLLVPITISLKHKFDTFLINYLIRVVPYFGIWTIFYIAQAYLVRKHSDFIYYPNSEHGNECYFNPIQNGLFRGSSRMGDQKGPLPKICHTYSEMMKLGTVVPHLKKIQKCMSNVRHPVNSADCSIFLPKISKFCYIKKYRYRLHFDT